MTSVVVALDVGGITVKCALVGPDGTVRHAERHATGRDRGADGEIGHIVVRPDGPACPCGQRGCLEAIASAASVGRRYARRAAAREGAATAETVAALAAQGDPDAVAVWQEAVDALADGLLIGLALFDPEAVVVGGG